MPEGVLHGGAIVGVNVSEEAAVNYYGGLGREGVLNSKDVLFCFVCLFVFFFSVVGYEFFGVFDLNAMFGW